MQKRLKLICLAEAAGLLNEPVRRDYWVHPFFTARERNERFFEFYNNVRKYKNKFFSYYRMSISSFDELLEKVRPHITKQHTHWRDPVCAEERLTITLRYLATGTNFAALQLEFYVGNSTINVIVCETCQMLWFCLNEIEMPEPTTEMWKEISETFYLKTNFPNCVGTIDGKHIKVSNKKKSGSLHHNYKGFFSIVLMAVVDSNNLFISIDVGAHGKEGDSNVFRGSPLGKKLYSGQLNLPDPKCLPNTATCPQPFVFVGDEAFALHTNLLKPFPRRNLNARRRVYNYRHSRCRRAVECAFGILANKWRIFHTAILVEDEFVDDIVKACCVLHNFVRKREGVHFEDSDADGETHPFDDTDIHDGHARAQGIQVRDYFADYFMGIGAVPFQGSYM